MDQKLREKEREQGRTEKETDREADSVKGWNECRTSETRVGCVGLITHKLRNPTLLKSLRNTLALTFSPGEEPLLHYAAAEQQQ